MVVFTYPDLESPFDTYPTLSNRSCFAGLSLSHGAEDFRDSGGMLPAIFQHLRGINGTNLSLVESSVSQRKSCCRPERQKIVYFRNETRRKRQSSLEKEGSVHELEKEGSVSAPSHDLITPCKSGPNRACRLHIIDATLNIQHSPPRITFKQHRCSVAT